MKISQRGFTLVELIVVIVILGILAATALPRFVSVQGDARAAVMQGVAGSIEGAKSLVRGKWMAAGSTGLATVTTTDNQSVTVYTGSGSDAGLPSTVVGGMDNAISYPSTVTCTGAATLLTCNYTGFPNCAVTYNGSGVVSVASAVAANC